MNREHIKQAEQLIKAGFSHHDDDKVLKLGYTDAEVVKAMELIFDNIIMIRMYNMSNAVVKYYSKAPNPPMSISEMRGYMYETSQLMLCDGYGLSHCVDNSELEYAVNYLIFEVENDE